MRLLLKLQVITGTGSPSTEQERLAVLPSCTTRSSGCTVMDGANG